MALRARKHLIRVLGLAMLVSSIAACDVSIDGSGGFSLDLVSGKAQDEWTRTYPLGKDGSLEIINVSGRITAEGSDGSAVEVRAERMARGSSDEAATDLLGKIEMREEIGEARVRIEVRAPRLSGLGGHEIRWTVRVPKGVNVDLRTVNGGVRLNGLDGEVRAKSTNGGVTGQALRATTLDASATNGGVDIQVISALTTGTFNLESVNGGVTLALPADSRADVTARCVNGGISVSELDVLIEGERDRRRLQGRLNGGGARVSLETTNGGVRLTRVQSS
jgi:Putative adhesin